VTSSYARNIMELIYERWISDPTKVVARYMDESDAWVDVTAAQFRERVEGVAKGLIARGVEPGQAVGIMCRTRYEWSVLDLAIWSAGALPVPIYDTSSSSQIDWITSDAGIGTIFVETEAHAALAREVASDAESPLTAIEVIDNGALDALVADGARIPDDTLRQRREAPGHEDIATIIYTSGTTGRPKGVRLTQVAYTRHIAGIQDSLHEIIFEPGASTVLFLTLAHSLARLVEVLLLASGTTVGYCPDTASLVPALGSFRPTLLLAVPRVFEKVFNSAEQKAAAGGKVHIFRWAAKQAIDYSKALDTPGGVPVALRLRHRAAHALVLSKIVKVLGGRARWAISGSAPLGERLGHFYRGLGISVLEGYGLTETNAASHVNRPELAKIGTVGKPLPGIEVSIAPDGEVLMRGDQLFSGYHHNAEATQAAMTDGWFMTGDIGSQDEDGYLTITGRKKEIIVTAGGKNVAPAVLEDRLRGHPLVSQCVVVGDGKPYIAALITLDVEALPGWLRSKGLDLLTVEQAAEHPVVLEHLDRAVERANRIVSRAESIRKYRIVHDDFTVDNGFLTPSLKVKRDRVLQAYTSEVEQLYATGS